MKTQRNAEYDATTSAPLGRHLIGAAFVRLLLLLYGTWHDASLEVRYTDVDYDVFTDGARLIWDGASPFERPTYRYTPLLALLLTPNVFLHPLFGKILFSVADLVVGMDIYAILCRRRIPALIGRTCACLWLFNPLVINVSTRGNFESLVSLFVLRAVRLILDRRACVAGLLLGCAIHLKPYPVIYVPAFVVALGGMSADTVGREHTGSVDSDERAAIRRGHASLRSSVSPRAAFLLGLAWSSLALGGGCYAWCGEAFVDGAWLYHLRRQDVRHNFAPHFYALYLSPASGVLRGVLARLAFAPQLALLTGCAARLGRDLPFCLLVQTVLFVSFNKVCTAQYFVWYQGLLPLALPSSSVLLPEHRTRTVVLVGAWTLAMLGWLTLAFQLEFRARHVFLQLWAVSVAFFASNVAIIQHLIRMHRLTPLFEDGRVVRQACLHEL